MGPGFRVVGGEFRVIVYRLGQQPIPGRAAQVFTQESGFH